MLSIAAFSEAFTLPPPGIPIYSHRYLYIVELRKRAEIPANLCSGSRKEKISLHYPAAQEGFPLTEV